MQINEKQIEQIDLSYIFGTKIKEFAQNLFHYKDL